MNAETQSRPAAHERTYLAQQGPYYGVPLERHKARCSICRHPRCEEIEQDFLDWTSPRELAQTYSLPDFRAIYRHANALGLFDQRRANIQRATDRIIEQVGDVEVNALAVVAAIRVTLNEERKWLESIHRLMTLETGEPEELPSPERLARPIPPAYRPANAAREFPAPLESSVQNKPAAAEILANKRNPPEPRRKPQAKSAAPTESRAPASPIRAAASESAARSAPDEKPPAASDSHNAPGQVAGLPWPWPAKKIQFARRRPWRFFHPG